MLPNRNPNFNSPPFSPSLRKVDLVRALVLLFICAIFFTSCTDKPPIPEKDFVEIYVQLELLDARYAMQPSTQKEKADSLMKAFKVTGGLMDSTLSWYSQKPERWRKFFADVQEEMGRIKPGFIKKKH